MYTESIKRMLSICVTASASRRFNKYALFIDCLPTCLGIAYAWSAVRLCRVTENDSENLLVLETVIGPGVIAVRGE